MRATAVLVVVVACTLAPRPVAADGHLDPPPAALDRLRAARSVAVLAPDVPMYAMVGFSDLPVRRPQWDADAGAALAAAVGAELARRGVQVREGPLPAGFGDEVRDILALFRSCAWVAAAGRDAYGWPALEPRSPTAPPAPGIGPLHALAAALGVDAVVLVTGRGVNRTAGYFFALTLRWAPASGYDRLVLAVAGPAGDLDWVSWYWSGHGDLRGDGAAARAARALLSDYPVGANLPRDPPPESFP